MLIMVYLIDIYLIRIKIMSVLLMFGSVFGCFLFLGVIGDMSAESHIGRA